MPRIHRFGDWQSTSFPGIYENFTEEQYTGMTKRARNLALFTLLACVWISALFVGMIIQAVSGDAHPAALACATFVVGCVLGRMLANLRRHWRRWQRMKYHLENLRYVREQERKHGEC